MKQILQNKNFFKEAKQLRKCFTDKFSDPRNTKSDRFVWDYWNIENQYRVLRTPARHFFPKELFAKLEHALTDYAQVELGCRGISDPWISYYVDGFHQNLHTDAPHGPWAYVYSLTDWSKRQFKGGETLLSKIQLTNYWNQIESDRGFETKDFFDELPALFNQLLVFDPRIPHGVKEVRGVTDPKQARLVINGWFVDPKPFIEGELSLSSQNSRIVHKKIEKFSEYVNEYMADNELSLHGTLCVRMNISASGKVTAIKILTDTLINMENIFETQISSKEFKKWLQYVWFQAEFPKCKKASSVTLPLLFR